MLFARSSRVQNVKGGVSAILKSLLKLFFDPCTHDLRRSGINVELTGGTSVHLWMNLGIVLADEAALHAMYGCKGAAGLKPCLLCQNIFNHQNARGISENDMDGWVQTHACTDSSKIVVHTPETIDAIVNRLAAAARVMNKSAFAELQTSLGWSLVPNGTMGDEFSRLLCEPTQHALYDWMHVLFVNGVFNNHCGRLLEAVKPFQITAAKLNEYIEFWNVCKMMRANVL